jgi:hypothetical protein
MLAALLLGLSSIVAWSVMLAFTAWVERRLGTPHEPAVHSAGGLNPRMEILRRAARRERTDKTRAA